jgi:HAMP domain-containing protein
MNSNNLDTGASPDEDSSDWSPPTGSAHDPMIVQSGPGPDTQLAPPGPTEQRTILIDEPQSATADSSMRKRSKGPLIIVAVAILVVVSLILANWLARNLEMMALLSQIEKSEAAMTVTQERIKRVAIPQRDPSSPAQPDEEELGDAAAELREIAAEGRDAVAAAGQEVAAVSFLPWHSSLVTAQSAYLDHNRAWVDYLDAASKDAAALATNSLAIETTWNIAEVRVREAIPMVPFPGIADRVDEIFKEGDSESSGPGIEASAAAARTPDA